MDAGLPRPGETASDKIGAVNRAMSPVRGPRACILHIGEALRSTMKNRTENVTTEKNVNAMGSTVKKISENPLGTRPIPGLLLSLAVPSVIANLVNALYNVVDQIFIGHVVGYLGNAATNIAFPITTVCLAIGLMTGLGSAAGFNLTLGARRPEEARAIAGTAFSSLLICGAAICILIRLSLRPLMSAFGATENILSYAMEYSSITSLGVPFLLFSIGTNPIVRGDGSPKYSMFSLVTGALLNIVLDAFFMLVLDMGIAGAAWATVVSQAVSACMLALYFRRFRNVRFSAKDFIPRWKCVRRIVSLGFASFIFQSSMVVVQVTVNNLLRIYGALSIYGSDVTIAVAGILAKINTIFLAVVIGVVQGAQPICSFNYGAEKYGRVKAAVRLLLKVTGMISVAAFILIQSFPRHIISLFGDGSEEYFAFAALYARSFMACIFLNGMQISASTFFPSIGKAGKGAVISLSKQLVILLPILFLFSHFWGLYGIIFAAPATDLLTFILASCFLHRELKSMPDTPDD